MEEGVTFSHWERVIPPSCRNRDIFTYDGNTVLSCWKIADIRFEWLILLKENLYDQG